MKYAAQIAIGLVAVGLAMGSACKRSDAKSAPPIRPTVSIAQPIPEKVHEWDEFTGRLASPETVEVRGRVSGYIDKIHFKEGGDVKQGDLLVTIDQRPYQAAVDRLKADLGAVRARAELARAEAKRGESLAATKAISTDVYETRLKTAAEAEQAVLSAEAALKSAQLDLEFTEVRAPISGRISNARVTAGNLVTGGSTANTTLLTTIVSLDPLYCYFEADEASALKYRQLHREGKRTSALFTEIPAEIGLGNELGFPHKATVDFVDNQINPATGTIRARAVLANPDKLMAPGFFARVRIPGMAEYDAVLVRDSAISSDQGRLFVLTVDDQSKTVYRAIKIGPIVNGLRVVREGLTARDRVIVSGLMSARPGVPVQPQTVPMSTNVIASVSAGSPKS
ncbi:MAG TPA: efflux RND transporter periplasmic adaptor subunit [Verrucomicrobiae bacterium]|nr:efflux RND transporter periplasmic adaptor subunit [Verrucomicrobiae bacterium]